MKLTNREETITLLASKRGITKVEAESILSDITEIFVEGLSEVGNKVKFMDGSFETVEVSAKPPREGRNPKTGEKITIGAKDAYLKVKFTAGKILKEKLNS